MNRYEVELTRLVGLGEKFIPPPPMLTDVIYTDRKGALEIILEKLFFYQEITGRKVETRVLIYQTELELIDGGLL